LGQDGQKILIDPLTVKNADVKFRFLASEKMASQGTLLQGLPILAQSILNPAFMQQLAQQGKKVNVEFLGSKIGDAFRLRSSDLFIPLTQEDQQRMAQPPPADQLKDSMQDKRLASQENIAQEGNAASIMKEMLSKGMDHAMANEPGEEDGEGE